MIPQIGSNSVNSSLSVLSNQIKSVAPSASPEAANMNEVATEFESVFMSLMIKQLRDTVEGGLFGEEKSDSLGALFDLYMGRHLAESNPLGIGRAVQTYAHRSIQS